MTQLAIYVTDDCRSCDESRRIAAKVREAFPGIEVALIDVNSGTAPAEVFAAPTYLLDGQVIFLGNPRRQDLWQRLTMRRHQPVKEAAEG